ncbi:MAG: hypothetical protein M3R54_04885, partial [Chloroflexota bacterium]|nr:hypothetical protein [Chloroflexota bacterium]
AATTHGFLASLGRNIRTYRNGALQTAKGYTEFRPFPVPGRRGGIVEQAGAVLLPRSWPSLRRAEFWVDPSAPLARAALAFAARVPALGALARGIAPVVGPGPFARHDGMFGVLITDRTRTASYVFSADRFSYLVAVEPAVIVAEALARGTAPAPGVALPHAQVDPELLFTRLRALGIRIDAGP